ncbi:MAG: Y-family DNA polymerase, partial [Thermaurantiacus sp.]
MPRIISLWLPNWPTDRLRRARSKAGALLPEPLVLAVRRGNRLEVGAACGQAQALGIRAGEALATVRARLPGLHVEDLDPAADADALARLARWLQARLSPLVALDPCDGLWLDAAGASHLFGGEERMLERIQARLARDGVKTRVGLADTAGAANALARYAAAPVAIAPVHGASEALAPLPVAALRLPPEDADALARLGIVSVSDLMALPRASVGRRFGIEVLKRLDQALGQAGEPLDYLPHAGKLSARLVLAEPVASSEALHALIDRLVPLLAQKLAQTGTGALRLDLLFRRLDGSVAAVRAGASAPTRDRAHIARLLHMLVEGIDPGFGIED